jgi:hypothetical protein
VRNVDLIKGYLSDHLSPRTDYLGEKLNGIRHANRSDVGIKELEDLWTQKEKLTQTSI